jgi:hypothetical protein
MRMFIGPRVERIDQPFLAGVKSEVKDQAINVDQNDGSNQDLRQPAKLLMKCEEHTGATESRTVLRRTTPTCAERYERCGESERDGN